ncbi:MAG: S8 family serine peptidase [Candidatus Cryptobacteroides sp.]
MNKRVYIILGAALLIAGCRNAELVLPQDKPAPGWDESVVQGELLVRFSPQVAGILEQQGLCKSSSISVNEVMEALQGCSLERVFPVDKRTEETAVKEGLNLWYVVRFGQGVDQDELGSRLSRLGEVSRVEYNRSLKKAYTGRSIPFREGKATTDSYFKYQWNLHNTGDLKEQKFIAGADVNVLKAWDLNCGEPDIIVAVLDEGVDYTHPELAPNMWTNEGEIFRSHEDNDGNGYAGDYFGYNFTRGTGVISTDDVNDTGHGTHVAGVIAAANDGQGLNSIAGGKPGKQGVRIMSCQIFSGNYAGTVLDEVRAIKYAADNGAVILQCSWGYTSGAANPYDWTPQYGDDETWKEDNMLEAKALDYFIHNAGSPDGVIEGGIAIFAAGNESAPAAGYPGAYPDFVSVAATAGDFTPAIYTNFGPGTTISAPGGDQDYYYDWGEGSDKGAIGCILSTLPKSVSESGYGYMEGTSMACPHVSGVVALGLSYAAQLRKHFKAEEVIELLYSSAQEIESHWNTNYLKYYYKWVSDLGENHYNSIDLNDYKGKMGAGQADAYAFLKAIEGAGVEMSFPNVLLRLGKEARYSPAKYFLNGENLSYEISIEDKSIADSKMEGNQVVFSGLKLGQTKANISAGNGQSFDFVITVKEEGGQGWL